MALSALPLVARLQSQYLHDLQPKQIHQQLNWLLLLREAYQRSPISLRILLQYRDPGSAIGYRKHSSHTRFAIARVTE